MGLIDKNEIIRQIQEYIIQQDCNSGIWNIGQCDEPHSTILNIIKRTSNSWMYIETRSPKIAGEIIDYCSDILGLVKDNNNGKSNSGNIIYIYKKNTPVKT